MLVTICVSLYTSRVILEVLGLSDYGLYNVVGGLLSFFSFINTAMSGCTQRYLNIAIGKEDNQNTKKIFSVAFTVHVALAALFFLVMLIIGGYLLEHQLVIEPSRMGSARWVLLITLISVCASFTFVPFDAAIVAHEKMDFYAFISILDVSVKLLVVYALLLFDNIDKLVLYAWLNLGGAFLVIAAYYIYCKMKFQECSLVLRKDNDLIKEMASFTGWSLLGNLTYMLSTQGINVILNLFYGTIINAAWGVATQVNGVLGRFSNSFQMASSPQIMKLYAAGDYNSMFVLTRNASKFAAFLVALIGLPLFIEIDFVLSKWLVEVPEHASFFVRIMIIQTLVTASAFPVSRAIVATGRIKASCIFNLVIQAIAVVATFLILKTMDSLYLSLYVQIIPGLISYAYMLYLVKLYTQVPVSTYLPMVFMRVLLVLIVACILPVLIHGWMIEGWGRCILVSISSVVMMILSVYVFGIDGDLRNKVNVKICSVIEKKGIR